MKKADQWLKSCWEQDFTKEAGMLGSKMAEKLWSLNAWVWRGWKSLLLCLCSFPELWFTALTGKPTDLRRWIWEILQHQVQNIFIRKAEEEKLDWVTMPEERRTELIDESGKAAFWLWNTNLFSAQEMNIWSIDQASDPPVCMGTDPLQTEQRLNRQDNTNLNSEVVRLTGLIQKEDENRVYVKVTDYKTGRKVFDITSFLSWSFSFSCRCIWMQHWSRGKEISGKGDSSCRNFLLQDTGSDRGKRKRQTRRRKKVF